METLMTEGKTGWRILTLDELKKLQIDLLDTVMDFCGANGIKCWLNGGTLLGAVRHKGYIPWDDDIDLGMLRPDYDKFMATFNSYNPRYEFHCIENDPDFGQAFGKVLDMNTILYEPDENGEKLSVNLDIFVMDNAPDDDKLVEDMFRVRNKYALGADRLRKGIFGEVKGNLMRRIFGRIYRALWFTAKLFPKKSYYLKKVAENSRRYINEKTERAGDFMGGGPWTLNAVMRRDLMENMTKLEFEGKMYNAPSGYDEWLTRLYGDYMQLPPPEKRVSHHRFKAYIKD